MEESMRERIALFRYGLIAPLLNGQVDRNTYLAEVSAKKHDVPCYGEKTYAAKTIQEWLLFYRRKGFDGLKPGTRSDQGKSRTLSKDQQDHVLALRKQHAAMPVTVFYDHLVSQGEILPGQVSYTTVHRFLRLHGLLQVEPAAAGAGRKRFAHDKVNHLWQTDMSEGPRLRIGGKLVRTHLLAFIDDCSRLVPFAQFVPTEKFDGLRLVMKEALLRRCGIPTLLYTDNGKFFVPTCSSWPVPDWAFSCSIPAPMTPKVKGK